MASVYMRKGQMVGGVFVPAGMAVYGLSASEAALAAQGGDGLVLPDPDVPGVPGGGSTVITSAALLAAKRAGTLTSGATYQVETGHRYWANSTSNFWPVAGSPILTGPLSTVLGDSFVQNGLYNGRVSTLAIHGWANTQMPVPLEWVANRGLGGKSFADVLAAQVPPTLADTSEIVWIGASRNPWLPVAASSTVDQCVADMRACLDALTPYKLGVIIDGSSSGVLASHDRATEVPYLNERLAAECARYPNVRYNDIYTAMVDPASAVGDVITAATYDNLLHPNTKGAQRIGRASAVNLARELRVIPRWTSALLSGGPAWTGTSGTKTVGSGSITGNVPDGINVWCSSGAPAVTTTIKDTLGSAGKRLNLVVANSGGAAGRVDVQLATTTLWNAQLAAGDWIRGWIGLRVKSIAAFNALYATMTVTGGGGATTFALAPNVGEASPNFEAPYVCRIPLPPVQLGAGFSAIQMALALIVGPTTGAADFDVWDYSLEKLALV